MRAQRYERVADLRGAIKDRRLSGRLANLNYWWRTTQAMDEYEQRTHQST